MNNLENNYSNIIVNRKGKSDDSYMITLHVIDIIYPFNNYKILDNGLQKTTQFIYDINYKINIPKYLEFDGKWLVDYPNEIQHKDANILGKFGKLEIDTKLLEVPIEIATENNLAYYGCKLLKINDVLSLETHDTLPLTIIDVGKTYVTDYILQDNFGGGVYLEEHINPHFHMPVSDDCSGGIMFAKKINNNKYHITCFKIPFGYAIYTPPYVIHNDCFLIGKHYVIYSISEPFSTCLLRDLNDNIIDVRIKF